MTFPTDSHTAPVAASGTTFATHPANGKEYTVIMTADSDGHLTGTQPAFSLVVTPQAVGASKVFFDLHNGSAGTLRLRSLRAIVQTDVAVTGVLGVRLDLFRTSAVGTGGTAAATTASTATTGAAFWPWDGGTALPSGITARITPTAGATSSQYLWPAYVFTEETSPAAHLAQDFETVPALPKMQPLVIPAGQGVKVVQGTVASVGSIGFLATFSYQP
jgi:hypothetical protein